MMRLTLAEIPASEPLSENRHLSAGMADLAARHSKDLERMIIAWATESRRVSL
jgi:hypothetical protein